MRSNGQTIAAVALVSLLAGWFILRRRSTRAFLIAARCAAPDRAAIMEYHRTVLFCRNLGLLLSSGVTFSTGAANSGRHHGRDGNSQWSHIVDKVRHGGKLSDAFWKRALCRRWR